ncbi:RNHCP domain protein [Leptospira wolbachii serovar Codice str. CDC]|uniref:RNHCP domain protein n=1 Tax=Leptospira wolbachii serovar Codice str. CDC TaxID=1218599 RepID=R9AB62_9LEPT|nr:RNHCP domain-containing protein [Leptospira wolbachii]EOQ97435.1 RNHCP domain protein [Leptospira wolbachii serovar Codice str. CDC]
MSRESDLSKFQKFSKKKRFDDEDEDISFSNSQTRSFRFRSDLGEFRCVECKQMVFPPGYGTGQRNHCPNCLTSLHIDSAPGDRSANCGSKMEAISIWVRKGEWVILHRCKGCGVIHANRIGPDDNEALLLSLAAQAMAKPSFRLFEENPVEVPPDESR